MSFSPVLPLSGIGGWALLQRVEADQREAFAKSPLIAREAAYFEEKAASAATPADLVGDRRLLEVALIAFGLEEEIDKRAFIRKVLESDTLASDSFANRLVDTRYRKLAEAFGYGDPAGARVQEPLFASKIVDAYRSRAYEGALGESDGAMRLALNARRELAAYAGAKDPDGAAWFAVMGDRPVREVLEKAFGLPSAFGQLDIDQQQEVLRDRTRELLGDSSLEVFADEANVETVIRRYLARNAAEQGPTGSTRGAAAVTLLQQGSAAFASLIQSRFG